MSTHDLDLERFRLRRLVEQLTELGEVEAHDEPVALADLSSIIETSDKAVLFRKAGPEQLELVAGVMGSRRRLAIALGVEEKDSLREYEHRLANPQKHFEVSSSDAPVHEVVLTGDDIDLTKLPFHLQHDLDGGPYISSAIDFSVDPATGKHNVGCRRMMLRGRKHLTTNLTAPSDLKLTYRACVERGERLPISFAIGSHPTSYLAATSRRPGDEFDLVATLRGAALPMVRGATNGVPAPADAEMIIEGYLDELGYTELDGPYGEFWGFYGTAHIDPVFHVTAIAMRRDVLHQSVLHGGRNMARMEATPVGALHTESAVRRALLAVRIEPTAVHAVDGVTTGQHVRVAIDSAAAPGQARAVISALFALPGMKHVVVVDSDIDVRSDADVEWALSTRFRADRDLVVAEGFPGFYSDPTVSESGTVSKVGLDATAGLPGDSMENWRPTPPRVSRERRAASVREALQDGPLYFREIMDALGNDDGREIVLELDELRVEGVLTRGPNWQWQLTKTEG
ncbi:MAG: UbiD family decarboxylase [Trebonia sp.]|jgi:UbiD family decarboxylase